MVNIKISTLLKKIQNMEIRVHGIVDSYLQPSFNRVTVSKDVICMDSPFNNCTIQKQRTLTWFLWSVGLKSAGIHHPMLAQIGACTMKQCELYEWMCNS